MHTIFCLRLEEYRRRFYTYILKGWTWDFITPLENGRTYIRTFEEGSGIPHPPIYWVKTECTQTAYKTQIKNLYVKKRRTNLQILEYKKYFFPSGV